MLHIRNLLTTAAVAAIAISLAACGGGGGGGTLPSTGGGGGTAPITPTQGNAKAQMVINIPAKSSSIAKNPKYISASTQSITVSLVSGSTTTLLAEADLTPSSPGCTGVAGGGTQCTISLVAAAGQQTFKLVTYDQTGGKGNVLSSGEVVATLVAGQNTSVPLVLDGTAVNVSLVLTPSELPVGTPASTGIVVQALDADGNLIVGPGAFTNPITLTVTGDSYNTLALSTSTVTSPGQVVTLNYNGGTNVGSTITPSGSGITGTPATFAGSGALVNIFQAGPNNNYDYYFYPYAVAALPNGQAALIVSGANGTLCCPTPSINAIAIASASASALTNVYFGNVTDPYAASPAPTSTPSDGSMTYVPGMSANVSLYGPNNGSNDGNHILAAGPTGMVYYTTSFTTSNDATNYSGNSESSGGIGVLSAGAAVEYNALGHPYALNVDSSGNLWFLEKTGTCNSAPLLANTYAIGELTSTGTMKTPVPLSNNVCYPADMSVSPSGADLYVVDPCNDAVYSFGTAALTGTPLFTVETDLSYDPETVATGADGTTAWFSDCTPGTDTTYSGWVPGTATFATANLEEKAFPINLYDAYSEAAGDQSFWLGGSINGETNCCGNIDEFGQAMIGRLSGLGAGSPVASVYELPNIIELPCPCNAPVGQWLASASTGGGYAWFADPCFGNIDVLQYGAPSQGAIAYTLRRGASAATRRNPAHPLTSRRAARVAHRRH